MIKYMNYSVTFQEVPNETSLCFNITNCQNNCAGCHSPELRENIGSDLEKDLEVIIRKYQDGITCVCFLGEGNDPAALVRCLSLVRDKFPRLKTCLYSGADLGDKWLRSQLLDYLKIGPYIAERGPLNNPYTNQRMYKIYCDSNSIRSEDITNYFWKKKENKIK